LSAGGALPSTGVQVLRRKKRELERLLEKKRILESDDQGRAGGPKAAERRRAEAAAGKEAKRGAKPGGKEPKSVAKPAGKEPKSGVGKEPGPKRGARPAGKEAKRGEKRGGAAAGKEAKAKRGEKRGGAAAGKEAKAKRGDGKEAKRGGKPAGKEPKAKRGEKRGAKPAGKEPKAKRGARGGRQDAKRPGRRRRSRKAEVDEADITDEETLGEGITDEEIANFQVGKANMEQLINRVCEMLSGGPSGGTLQGDVWRRLKLTLSDGFRLALKLEWLGLITREKVLEDGRWTYRLILKRTPISTRSIVNAPCLTCPVEQKCTPDGEVSPHTCDLIRDWVLAEAGRARRRS